MKTLQELINDIETLNSYAAKGNLLSVRLTQSIIDNVKELYGNRHTPKIKFPSDIYGLLKSHANEKQEKFIVITLNGGNEFLNLRVVTIGTLNRAIIHPREVFADAITDRAAAVILAHNHTSSNLEPSREDIKVTNRMKDAGKILGIKVLDHIVFNQTGFNSIIEYVLQKEGI